MSERQHPLETDDGPASEFPLPQRIDVPGARITYTHQASSGRTFGFETLIEQMADREVIDGILDTWVGAATRQQAKIELLKAEHDLHLVEKRIRLLERDRIFKQEEWRLSRERSGRRTRTGEDWQPSVQQQANLDQIDKSIQDEKETLETIKRSIADYATLMNGHDPSFGAANAG